MNDRLLFLLSRAQHVLKNHLKNEFARQGITVSPAQMGILFALEKSEGLSMNELAGIIAIDNAAVTRHIDSLERDRFVERAPDSGDRRKTIIVITEAGKTEAERCARTARRINDCIKEGHSPAEVEAFKAVLNGFFQKFT